MIPVPSGVQVWLATRHADMRKGFDGLALLVRHGFRTFSSDRRSRDNQFGRAIALELEPCDPD